MPVTFKRAQGGHQPRTARYKCTHCKRTEVIAREFGCGGTRTKQTACPMDLRFLFDRLRYRFFGVLPK